MHIYVHFKLIILELSKLALFLQITTNRDTLVKLLAKHTGNVSVMQFALTLAVTMFHVHMTGKITTLFYLLLLVRRGGS